MRSTSWARLFLVLSVVLIAWSAAIWVTGGFYARVGSLRISSRDPGRALLFAALAAAIAWRVAGGRSVAAGLQQLPHAYRRFEERLRLSARRFDRLSLAVAAVSSVLLIGVGIRFGSRVAGGADAFGYVSASALWRDGLLGLDHGWAATPPSPLAAGAFVPLAYRLGEHDVVGPTVAPGLPLLMAAARLIGSCAPFLVMPACGGALVLLTFLLGRRLFGAGVALAAALLVACSPVVVFQSLVVMADVPAAAFWMAALTIASTRSRRAPLFCGLLAGAAIAIRPNLAPLAVFPWMLSWGEQGWRGMQPRVTAWYALGVMPAALFVGWVNYKLYGSPFSSGYGDIGEAFAVRHARVNLALYARWWLETQGPLAFVFLAALWRRPASRRFERLVLVAYAAAVVLLYAFYLPFDQWWYLRFVIPAVPVVLLLCADAVDWIASSRVSIRAAALALFVAFAAAHAVTFIASKDILTNSAAERRRYLDAARFLDSAVPSDAVVLAMQHSGSVRYYAGRLTMRWDAIDARSIDGALSALRTAGLPVYALLEDWEEQDFRRRFAGRQAALALSTPLARSTDDVRLYALDPHPQPVPVVMPQVDGGCIDVSPRFIYPDGARRLARLTSAGRPSSER